MLIGGSALALRIGHRRSEDLDLAFPDKRLPRGRLDGLLLIAAQAGFDFRRDDDEAALQDFAQDGLELHNYQQNFIVNDSVKVSFFAPDSTLAKVLTMPPEPVARIGALPELFKTKCLVSAVRSKTRDWLDLYLLLQEHGFTMRDFACAFREAGAEHQRDIALARLCSGVPQKDDEGYAHLLDHPPSLQEMTSFFVEQRRLLEVQSAAEAKGQRRKSH